MYIFKNALRCISRSKGRNILIGIIALVIAVSACIGLSIRQAAESARKENLEGMSVTATISFDRQSMMGQMAPPDNQTGQQGGFDRDKFSQVMGDASSLTLDEYKTYAKASTVKDFYYTLTAYFNGSDSLEPVSTETEEEETTQSQGGGFGGMFGGGKGGMFGGMMNSGDFTVVGYSSDNAMTNFKDGASVVSDGVVFEEGTEDYNCIISEELALFNNITVGDKISITNTRSEDENYEITVVGIYSGSESNDLTVSMFGVGQDPANRIYMSSAALQKILDKSQSVSTTVTDDTTNREYETAITGTLSATYCFADTDGYYEFEEEVRTLGLSDSYTVSSPDLTKFENSLTPLNTLSTMAGWFLLVILIIGAIILVVLNIFNIRERKYEIGVLTAMGMKKIKVALQFMTEILVVTMAAVIIGAGIGAVSAVPVTNALLANQIESQQNRQETIDGNFGRPGNTDMFGGMGGASDMPNMSDMDEFGGKGQGGGRFEQMFGAAADYVTEVNSAMNLTVVMQMLGIGLLLTIVASAVSVLFVMRYDPLKILANRD